MNQKINEISITPIRPINGLVGFASFVFDNSIYVGSVAIHTRPLGGYRLIYPNKKIGDKNIPFIYPISSQIGREIEEVIIKKFEEVMNYDRHGDIGY